MRAQGELGLFLGLSYSCLEPRKSASAVQLLVQVFEVMEDYRPEKAPHQVYKVMDLIQELSTWVGGNPLGERLALRAQGSHRARVGRAIVETLRRTIDGFSRLVG